MRFKVYIPDELDGQVWHTTSLDSLKKIHIDGYIKVFPGANSVQHKIYSNSVPGFDGKTYVQSLGGVSLFDFKDFNTDEYLKEANPNPDIFARLIPIDQRFKDYAAWLCIDTSLFTSTYLNRFDLYKKWLSSKPFNAKYIPLAEATILGDIPISSIKKILIYSAETKKFNIV